MTVASVHAGIDDAILRFSTPGPDHYADNRLVADGECYALVWSPAGESFAGFNADGTPANESDRLILAAPLAKGGRCPETIFQVPAATYAELADGEWAVCLIDTRDARDQYLRTREADDAGERELARRVLALYGEGRPDKILDRPLRDAFLFAQWRLAVLARHRANAYDAEGCSELAMEETRLADELDKLNGAIQRIRATMAWASKRRLERMTPQEGLRLGLARADFALARMFALRVLDTAPDDPAANFALGMDFFVQRQYTRAQQYLERCLERRPDDPAVLNNLAQCHLRRGDAAGALPYAQRALAILPDSSEVKLTMERIQSALAR
ncbi:MAG: tetratricopeptide repeat protein [Kiritimatiellae bacterium]|nr:tetratricopeptide repeat protein [Kiritimatiellia bacterium]